MPAKRPGKGSQQSRHDTSSQPMVNNGAALESLEQDGGEKETRKAGKPFEKASFSAGSVPPAGSNHSESPQTGDPVMPDPSTVEFQADVAHIAHDMAELQLKLESFAFQMMSASNITELVDVGVDPEADEKLLQLDQTMFGTDVVGRTMNVTNVSQTQLIQSLCGAFIVREVLRAEHPDFLPFQDCSATGMVNRASSWEAAFTEEHGAS
jgi:hypothetical protein